MQLQSWKEKILNNSQHRLSSFLNPVLCDFNLRKSAGKLFFQSEKFVVIENWIMYWGGGVRELLVVNFAGTWQFTTKFKSVEEKTFFFVKMKKLWNFQKKHQKLFEQKSKIQQNSKLSKNSSKSFNKLESAWKCGNSYQFSTSTISDTFDFLFKI